MLLSVNPMCHLNKALKGVPGQGNNLPYVSEFKFPWNRGRTHSDYISRCERHSWGERRAKKKGISRQLWCGLLFKVREKMTWGVDLNIYFADIAIVKRKLLTHSPSSKPMYQPWGSQRPLLSLLSVCFFLQVQEFGQCAAENGASYCKCFWCDQA